MGFFGPDVLAMIEEFQQGNCGMERINKSHLFLLPKQQRADRVEDFLLISLSNSIYLIIAKVVANRLRESSISIYPRETIDG